MNIRLTMTMNILLYDYVDACTTTGGEGLLPEEWSDRPWARCSSASSPPRPASSRLLPLSACVCRCRPRRNCRQRLQQGPPPSKPICRPTRRRPPIWPRRIAQSVYS